jgi:hypothetical protein
MDEHWLPAPGLQGYEVSDRGNLRVAATKGMPSRRGRAVAAAPRVVWDKGIAYAVVGNQRRKIHHLVNEVFGPAAGQLAVQRLSKAV